MERSNRSTRDSPGAGHEAAGPSSLQINRIDRHWLDDRGSPVNGCGEAGLGRSAVRTGSRGCINRTGIKGRRGCAERSGLPGCAERRFRSGAPIRRRAGEGHYPQIMVNAAEAARQLIRIVATDPGLPRYHRSKANSLEYLISSKPDLVVEELEVLRDNVLPDLALHPPLVDYVRCVSVPVFWRYHLRHAERRIFRTADLYRRYLESLSNRVDVIRRHLRDDEPLVPAAHSWLVPVSRILGLDGPGTKRHLRTDHEPPYIVMVFPAERMDTTGVRIREPRGVDAVPARLLQWSPGDVPDERIDQDIPTAALGGIEWRP